MHAYTINLDTAVDCPECSTTFHDAPTMWEIYIYEDGSVMVEEYFDCIGGCASGSPVWSRGCGSTFQRLEYGPDGEAL